MFERFTDRSRRVLVLAQEEARLLAHSFIGTEHLLLGLIAEGEGVAAQALENLGVSLAAVRAEVAETIGMAGTPPSGSPPFTPRAKRVLEFSLREALQLGDSYIGTEHLLLGLLREGEGVALTILLRLGVEAGRVRQETIMLMTEGAPRSSVAHGYGADHSEWVSPLWDRPSEGTVPAVVPVNALLFESDVVALAVDCLDVYPNGFTINFVRRVNPRQGARSVSNDQRGGVGVETRSDGELFRRANRQAGPARCDKRPGRGSDRTHPDFFQPDRRGWARQLEAVGMGLPLAAGRAARNPGVAAGNRTQRCSEPDSRGIRGACGG